MSTVPFTFGKPTSKERDEFSLFLKTECGQLLQDAVNCVKRSTNQVKGIDCHELIREYLDCCQATPEACAERFSDPDYNPFATEEEAS